MEFFSEYYTSIKVLHVIAFCAWMAFLFYMPRLFVYHTEHKENKDYVKVVKIQESKLFNMIGYPSIILTVLTGVGMILGNPYLLNPSDSGLWLHIKLLMAIILVAYHISLYFIMKALANERYAKSGKFYRIYNEVPTICLIVIAILVIAKPI